MNKIQTRIYYFLLSIVVLLFIVFNRKFYFFQKISFENVFQKQILCKKMFVVIFLFKKYMRNRKNQWQIYGRKAMHGVWTFTKPQNKI